MKFIRTYKDWEEIRMGGRGGKKKVRRDTTLATDPDGALTFTYTGYRNCDLGLLATLTTDNVYTLTLPKGQYAPTFGNIFRIIVGLNVYSDMSHFKHYQQPVRIHVGGRRWGNKDLKTMPFVDGLRYKNGVCLNPEIAVDYKRTLNRTLSLPWLRKTEVLAKVLRVATRMRVLERDTTKRGLGFEFVNIEDPTAADAEIILAMGSAMGMYGWRYNHATQEEQQAALLRCAENGLADYREWLYLKHGCYEMLPVEHKTEGEAQ